MFDIKEKKNCQTHSLVDILCHRVQYQPDETGYIFLNDGELDETRLTYRELDRKARTIAVKLRSIGAAGERALLLYPPGLEYICAFFGCLYAGVTAVPVYPPHPARLERTLPRLKNIAKDARPFAVMTSSSILTTAEPFLSEDPDFGNAKWLSTDNIPTDGASGWQIPSFTKDSLAFLQYTSGSTGIPKGVMVSHENLICNLDLIQICFGNTHDSLGVIWLPPYHDMGLIGGILQPLYAGIPVILMSPVHFLQKPFRWLDAISRYKATASGGPNFAYDLCIRKITPDQLKKIDLSSWEVAFNGAEPIRYDTMEQFYEVFGHCGFRKQAFYPCYGLAEGTLIVSGGLKNDFPVWRNFKNEELRQKRAVSSTFESEDAHTLVGCGKNLSGQKITIVDVDTFRPRGPGEIGEIWVSGKSVAQGYWQKPEETKQFFQAYISDTNEGPFLRTGDLGFFSDEELFITGRLKDLIIIRGKNHYPQDIELTAEKSCLRLRPGCSAAFEVEINGEKKVVIAAEMERRQRKQRKKSDSKKDHSHPSDQRQHSVLPDYNNLENRVPVALEIAVKAIRKAVSEEHELEVYAVLILKIGTIPKTSSGKIQRHACREKFLNKTLDILESNIIEDNSEDIESKDFPDKDRLNLFSPDKRREVLESFLQDIVSIAFKNVLSGDKININDNFFDLGGDSILLVRLHNRLHEVFNKDIPITAMFKYPTIKSLAQYLARDDGEEKTFDFRNIRDRVKKRKEILKTPNDVAIVGMAGRFPGAKNIDEFWRNLCNGTESVTNFTDEEIEASGEETALLKNPNYVKAGAILDNIEMFDARFFGISPREAAYMDPQHRLFLECAWEAFENAGYVPEKHEGRVGVYAGAFMNSYLLNNLSTDYQFMQNDEQVVIYNDKDYLPTRVSYNLNLKGPSVSISTACSTSLVAVHLAYQSLLNYECDMAAAGGVAIMVPQKKGYLYHEGGMRSPDGRCRAFDANARGTLFGSGVGIVILKRLENALKDKDFIYAVIKGTAVNNDGSVKAGFTAPGVNGQTEAVVEAHAVAGIESETITYVETHGTGTSLGDPIEIEALTQAFGTQKRQFCGIGSVKPNVGHLNMAAGITGLIKTALAIKYKKIPPSINFEQPNPDIDFENSPFYVNTELLEWKTDDVPRRAGVSAYGIGGTNAHVILEEYEAGNSEKQNHTATIIPQSTTQKQQTFLRPCHLIALSARTDDALNRMTKNLADHLKQYPDLNLADVAYTLQTGRKAFSHRRIMVCRSIDEATDAFGEMPAPDVLTGFHESGERPVVFMFSGQGAQYTNMGLELYETEPEFRSQVDLCSELLKSHLKSDLRQLLYPNLFPDLRKNDGSSLINRTDMAQPALFVIEYAMARLWMAWGVHPRAMIGHSIGEYVAACLAGVLSLNDALSLVADRGRMMQEMSRGDMLAIPLPEKDVQAMVDKANNSPQPTLLSVAAVNTPSLCVVSGPVESVKALHDNLSGQGVNCRLLHTSHAFHSDMMEPVLAPFIERVKSVVLNPPRIPYASNVTGTWITNEQATDPSYWANHLRKTVRFADGIKLLLEDPPQIFLEIGPGRTLTTFAMGHPDKTSGHTVVNSMRHPQDKQSDSAFLFTTIGRLWLSGVNVDWGEFQGYERRCRVPLPAYPFERKRCWVDPLQTQVQGTVTGKKPEIADWFYVPSWERRMFREEEVSLKESDCWMVFTDEHGLGKRIRENLIKDGQDIIVVRGGLEFSQNNGNDYTINPMQQNDYADLFSEIRKNEKIPNKILHMWNITEKSEMSESDSLNEQSLDMSFYSLLFLAQALGVQNFSEEIRIAVISDHMQEVIGGDLHCPGKAALLGPVKVIPQEYPNIKCCSIDISLSGSEPEKIADRLTRELAVTFSDTVMAYRGNYRWVQTFKPAPLDEIKASFPDRLREKGVYMITGGLGGIGLVLAEYLAKTVQARLVLTGRSLLPARDKWDDWLNTHDDNDEVSQKILSINNLENSGAEILFVSADVTDLEQMQKAVLMAVDRFGNVNGVIHAAGMPGGGIIQRRTFQEAEAVLKPKVKGTLVLDRVLKSTEPDFIVFCSSIVSIFGGFGQADYSAANAFLDAFAHVKNYRDNIFSVAVNWDIWQNVGMAANTKLQEGISVNEGLEVFKRILSHTSSSQVVVSATDFELRAKKNYILDSVEKLNENKSETIHPRPNLANPYIEPRNNTEEIITVIFQDLLGLKKVGVYDDFFELGGHSLIATQVVSRLRETFHVELSLNAMFEGPSAAEIARQIEDAVAAMKSGTLSENYSEERDEGEI